MKIDRNGYFCHASFILLLVLWPGSCSGKPCKCGPTFHALQYNTFTFATTQKPVLRFRVRTNTTDYEKCQMTKVESRGLLINQREHTPESFNCLNITGTPPQLMVTVRLDNISKKHEGFWRLDLTNEDGTGHIDFFIHVRKFPPLPTLAPKHQPEITTESVANTTSNDTESNTTENTTIDISTEKAFLSSSSNSNQRSLLVTIGIANIAVFLLFIFVVAGAIAFCYRRSLRTTDQPSSLHPEQQAAQREPMLAIERGESTISSQSSAGQFSLDRSSLHRSSSDQSSSSMSQSYSSDSSSTQRSSGESSNTYAEVNDESPRSSGDVPPPLPCRRPASLPADYLHPAHSLSAVVDAESALQNDVAMRR